MIVVMMVVVVMTMPSFDVLLLPTFGFVCAKSLELGQSSWAIRAGSPAVLYNGVSGCIAHLTGEQKIRDEIRAGSPAVL